MENVCKDFKSPLRNCIAKLFVFLLAFHIQYPAAANSRKEAIYLNNVVVITCKNGYFVEGYYNDCVREMSKCLRQLAHRGADGVYSIAKCYKDVGSWIQGRELQLSESFMPSKYYYLKEKSEIGLECLDEKWIVDRASWGTAKRACLYN